MVETVENGVATPPPSKKGLRLYSRNTLTWTGNRRDPTSLKKRIKTISSFNRKSIPKSRRDPTSLKKRIKTLLISSDTFFECVATPPPSKKGLRLVWPAYGVDIQVLRVATPPPSKKGLRHALTPLLTSSPPRRDPTSLKKRIKTEFVLKSPFLGFFVATPPPSKKGLRHCFRGVQ